MFKITESQFEALLQPMKLLAEGIRLYKQATDQGFTMQKEQFEIINQQYKQMIEGFQVCSNLIVNLHKVIDQGFAKQKEQFEKLVDYIDEKENINDDFLSKLYDQQTSQLSKYINLQSERLIKHIEIGPKPRPK